MLFQLHLVMRAEQSRSSSSICAPTRVQGPANTPSAGPSVLGIWGAWQEGFLPFPSLRATLQGGQSFPSLPLLLQENSILKLEGMWSNYSQGRAVSSSALEPRQASSLGSLIASCLSLTLNGPALYCRDCPDMPGNSFHSSQLSPPPALRHAEPDLSSCESPGVLERVPVE